MELGNAKLEVVSNPLTGARGKNFIEKMQNKTGKLRYKKRPKLAFKFPQPIGEGAEARTQVSRLSAVPSKAPWPQRGTSVQRRPRNGDSLERCMVR